MADFESQVKALTGLTIDGSSTDPGRTELSTFLKDGVIDVTSRCLAVRPQDADDFVIESTESSSQGGLSTDGGKILYVMRESGTNDDWRDCRKIPIGLKDRVTDTTSLHYASAYNPAYILSQYGAVLVFPAPSGSSGQYRIYYVNKTPVDNASGAALAYNASTIRYFPDDKVYLVVIYASIKSLEAAMSAKSIPTISGDGTAPIELTDVSPLDADNTVDTLGDQGEIDQWWSTLGHFIEDEEDSELASSQVQKITAYIQAHQSQLAANTTDYQWMQARHQILSIQYDKAFNILIPPKQQSEQTDRRIAQQ